MSKNRLLPIKLILIWTLLLITPAACNSVEKEHELSIQTIERKELSGTGVLYEAGEPGLIVIARLEEVARLEGLITEAARQKLLELDYDRFFALAAFFGIRGTGGSGIQVNRLSRLGDTVSVYAQLFEPGPDQQKTTWVTSPYHLMIVQKEGNWGKEISFALIANHMLFFSVSHEIP